MSPVTGDMYRTALATLVEGTGKRREREERVDISPKNVAMEAMLERARTKTFFFLRIYYLCLENK